MPEKYSLHLCKTKMDYTRMYSVRDLSSCVYMNNNWLCGKPIHDLWREFAKRGWYPGVLFKFSPEIKGMYMVKEDGTPVARTYVRLDAAGKPIEHVDIRATSMRTFQAMENLLQEKGLNETYTLEATQPFTVPGFQYKSKYLCPIPNIDMVWVGGLWVKFNEDTKNFTVSPKRLKDSVRIDDTYQWQGYIVAPGYDDFYSFTLE